MRERDYDLDVDYAGHQFIRPLQDILAVRQVILLGLQIIWVADPDPVDRRRGSGSGEILLGLQIRVVDPTVSYNFLSTNVINKAGIIIEQFIIIIYNYK